MRFSKTTKKKEKRKRYGVGREEIDFTAPAYELAKERFFDKLRDDQNNRHNIEVETRGQRHVLKWILIRRNLLTPSYFGKILNVKNRSSFSKIVGDILYKNEAFSNSAEVRHQRILEMEALQIFIGLYGGESIASCGIFIDSEIAFLGTSPFRLYRNDSIICIKCPKRAFKKNMKEAINKKLLPIWKGAANNRQINTKSHWYLEIQGQLHITKRRFAHLIIYLGEGVYEIIEIERNDEFWNMNMKSELTFFYTEAMLKEIIDPRDARGMDLRKYNSVSQTFE